MSQLSDDFKARDEFWADVDEVIEKLDERGDTLERDLVMKIALVKDQEDVMALREASNAYNDASDACWDRKLLSELRLEQLTDLFEDAMAIEIGVFELIEIYNENEGTVH